ncbi:MAG: hypothetical protein JNK89_08505 [Saprospiraceae bacterium]|nr:hypothetical protein [Saprospiraceae bacterium]
MKPFSLICFLAVFALSLLFSCSKCKDEPADPCALVSCSTGFTCVDGACICPEGNLLYAGNCIPLNANTYVGYNGDCFCYDTLALAILGEGPDRIVQMPVVINGAIGSASTTASYFERPDGDSIYILQLPMKCFIQDTIPAYPEASGRLQADGSWRLHLLFRHGITREALGQCSITIRKQ